jgi:threonine/homoserine/homoserine lactone efflux protein
MLAAVLTFSAASALIVMLPGPDTLVVVRNLVRGGRGQAVRTAVGVLSGLVVWVGTASLGLSALLRASRTGYDVLRIVGAAYLLYLGVQSLRSRTVPMSGADAGGDSLPVAARRRGLLGVGYGAGLATDLLNPKVGVFFVTFLPGFVPHGENVGLATLLFGAIFILQTALYFTVVVSLASRVTGWMTNMRTKRRLDRATGLVLIGFGLRLATEA